MYVNMVNGDAFQFFREKCSEAMSLLQSRGFQRESRAFRPNILCFMLYCNCWGPENSKFSHDGWRRDLFVSIIEEIFLSTFRKNKQC
jgi:hypothetical protein